MKNSITALMVYKFHAIVSATGADKDTLSHDNLDRLHRLGSSSMSIPCGVRKTRRGGR
jgi:hypothetical protein